MEMDRIFSRVLTLKNEKKSCAKYLKFETSMVGLSLLQLRNSDVLVRLSIGDLVGQKVTVNNVPWTPDHDPMEQIRKDWTYYEPDSVSPLNNVTVVTFLGIPYAEPPVSQRRFKVKSSFSFIMKCSSLLQVRLALKRFRRLHYILNSPNIELSE